MLFSLVVPYHLNYNIMMYTLSEHFLKKINLVGIMTMTLDIYKLK